MKDFWRVHKLTVIAFPLTLLIGAVAFTAINTLPAYADECSVVVDGSTVTITLPASSDPVGSLTAVAASNLPAYRGVVISTTNGDGTFAFALPGSEDGPVVGFTTASALAGENVTVKLANQVVSAELEGVIGVLPNNTIGGRPLKINGDGTVSGLLGGFPTEQGSQAVLVSPSGTDGDIVEIFFFGGQLRQELPPDAG